MTEDLVRWAAEKVMGWRSHNHYEPAIWYDYNKDAAGPYVIDWNPTTDLNHAFMVVERMREFGWWLDVYGPDENESEWKARFRQDKKYTEGIDDNLCLAILKAAKAAWEGRNG